MLVWLDGLAPGRARDYLAVRTEGIEVRLTAIAYGKYAGRVVARAVLPGGEDLAAGLFTASLGHAYGGGTSIRWCDRADGPDETEAELAKPRTAR